MGIPKLIRWICTFNMDSLISYLNILNNMLGCQFIYLYCKPDEGQLTSLWPYLIFILIVNAMVDDAKNTAYSLLISFGPKLGSKFTAVENT